MKRREYRSAGARARSALARVRRGRDSPQARGGGGSGVFDTDCQLTAYVVGSATTAIGTDDIANTTVSHGAIVHAAFTQPAGIVGQHGCWPWFCDGAVGVGI